jgi:hypothetical protein
MFSKEIIMKITKMLRTLGVALILVAGISFLFEGWHDMNGLSKYIGFFGFLLTFFGLSEYFEKRQNSQGPLFSGVFLVLAPVIPLQLASFIYDQYSVLPASLPFFAPLKLPEGSPLSVITISSFLVLIPMLWRKIISLGAKLSLVDLTYFATIFLAILIPERGGTFHSIIILSGGALLLLSTRFSRFEKAGDYDLALRLSPLLLILGRGLLYGSHVYLFSVIYLIISMFFYFVVPALVNEGKNLLYFVASIFLVLATRNVFDDSNYTLVFTMLSILVFMQLIPLSKKVGIWTIGFLVWFKFSSVVVMNNELTIEGFAWILGLSLFYLAISFFQKIRLSFLSSLAMTILVTFWSLIKMIDFPLSNVWFGFGAAGLIILLISVILDKNEGKIFEKWKELLKDLD